MRGEVLRFDGECDTGQICGSGQIRTCIGGDVVGVGKLCEWNIIPKIFNPLIGGVFHYSHTKVELTFKGLSGVVLIRRGGRLSQLRKSEFKNTAPYQEWSSSGYDWQREQCTTPVRSAAVFRSFNTTEIGTAIDPGSFGSTGSQNYLPFECDMGQASNNATFTGLSPYITHLQGRVTNFDDQGNVVGIAEELNFPTIGHAIIAQKKPTAGISKLILKCFYCQSQTAKIWIGGESINGEIVGGSPCNFDATQDWSDPAFANPPLDIKRAAIYECEMPAGQGYKQPVWIDTDSGPSGEEGQNGPNVIHYKSPVVATYTSSYKCNDETIGDICSTTKDGTVITLTGSDFGISGNVEACTWGIVSGVEEERCWPTTSIGTTHDTASFTFPAGVGGEPQAMYVRVIDQNSGVPGVQLDQLDRRKLNSFDSISTEKSHRQLNNIPIAQTLRYTKGVVIGTLMPPRRDPTGGYDVEIYGFDFANSLNGKSSTQVKFGDVVCHVKSSTFDRIVCTMGDSTQSTGGGSAIQVWIGPGETAPSVQLCTNALPQDKLGVLQLPTLNTRQTQLYNAVIALRSAEIALVQTVVLRTGGLAHSLIAADSLEALFASEKPGNVASSLQIDVLAQEEGGYYWTNLTDANGVKTWVAVTPEQIHNADAAWATRDAALAEADGSQDSFQTRLLLSSKHADATTLEGYMTAGSGADLWVNKVLEIEQLYPLSLHTPTYILMLAAQNFGRVNNVGDGYLALALSETPTISGGLTQVETNSENTATTVGRVEEVLLEGVNGKEKELVSARNASDVSDLTSLWPSGGQCFGNVTCSMLRLKLKDPNPPRQDDLVTVAQSFSCVDTDQSMGGAKIFPADTLWEERLERVRTGISGTGATSNGTETSSDYLLVANLCVLNTMNLEREKSQQQARAESTAARVAAEAGSASGSQLEAVIPAYFKQPYSTEVKDVLEQGNAAPQNSIDTVNDRVAAMGSSANDLVVAELGSSLIVQQIASNCNPTTRTVGVILTPQEETDCNTEQANNPCFPGKCTTSSAPDIRTVLIHYFNSSINITERARAMKNVPTSAETVDTTDGKTHRMLVEIRGANFGSEESALNVSFVSYTSGGPFVYTNGWTQTAKTIFVPSVDIFTRDEIINAASNLQQYSVDRNMNGQPDGFRSYNAGSRLFFWCPPGQGKDLVIRITRRIASGAELVSAPSQDAGITYSTPVIFAGGVYTESPYRYAPKNSGPTDGCTTGAWESLLQWAARIEGVTEAQRIADPRRYGRMCQKFHSVVIEGSNFGRDASLLTVKAVIGKRTYFLHDGPNTYLSCEDRCGVWVTNPPPQKQSYHNPKCGTRQYFVPQMQHSHSRLVLCAPRGYGRGLDILVEMAGQPGIQAVPARWDFEQPELIATFPNPFNGLGTETAATLSMSNKDGVGIERSPRTLEIRGNNFGAVENVPQVIIDGKQCELPVWHAEHPVDGFPYITCEVQPNVVGAVNMSFFVANQWSKKVDVIANIRRAAVRSECIAGTKKDDGSTDEYWGRIGELCTLCTKGETCSPGTYLPPYALPGFWLETLDISGPTLLARYPDAVENEAGGKLLEDNDKNDMDMAKGTYDDNVVRKCPKERLLDAVIDSETVENFPLAVASRRDTCTFAAACMPTEACNGSNTCAPNYEGKRLKCEEWTSKKLAEVKDQNATKNLFSCTHTLQCRNRGFDKKGADCGRAIETVCGCAPDWAASVDSSPMSCLKACIRTPAKLNMLLDAGCRTGEQLGRSLTGADCGSQSPEECSVCIPSTNALSGITTGTCSCQASRRCVWCTYGTHYRMEGKCEECPENPALVIAGIIFALIVCCFGSYMLDKRDFNLAFISIGVDYFQVLALFASADVRWPSALKTLFRMLSFFNLNLDIAAPECLVPEFKYEWKFYGTLLLPIVAAVLFLGSTICKRLSDKCIMQRTKSDKFYMSKMIGISMLLMYYLYLMTARRALEIFNCNPSEPDDGFLYTQFADEECDGGICKCNDPNHIQVRLVLPAVVALLVYTLGYPLMVFLILRSNKRLVKEDQLLRTLETGDTPGSNKYAYHIRRRYHKLYYHFKPGKWYWIVIIIARKAGIVVAGLMFRANPGFQLSLILLVLFTAYVFQVKHQPYMSTAQRKEVRNISAKRVVF